jgi:hypothetical protein
MKPRAGTDIFPTIRHMTAPRRQLTWLIPVLIVLTAAGLGIAIWAITMELWLIVAAGLLGALGNALTLWSQLLRR